MRAAQALLLLVLAAAFAASAPDAQARTGSRAGDFDFYVLSLSWSPTYCQVEATAADQLQCGPGRRNGFVVHGLWPQYERGYPEFCAASPREAPAQVVRGMLDLMPSRDLVRHEWQKHGACSGLTPDSYFALVRKARARIVLPPDMARQARGATAAPRQIEDAFIRANPGLRPDGIAVMCSRQRLEEIRICLTKDLRFRPCPEVDARSCRAGSIQIPPIP